MDENSTLLEIAEGLVFSYVKEHLDLSDKPLPEIQVHTVWFAYILGNWKALCITLLPDGMYYEVTFDVHRGVAYLDPYKRFDHKEIAIPARRR